MIPIAVLGVLALAGTLVLMRVVAGPGPLDRSLAAHALALLGAVAAGALGLAVGEAAFVDVAIASLAVQLVVAVALYKAVRRRSFQSSLAGLEAASAARGADAP